MSKCIYFPKWVCAGAILLSVVALIAQAVIDVRQGTMGVPLFSDQWFAQAWQTGLITPFIILTVAIAAQYLAAGAYIRSGAFYLAAVVAMCVTVTNGADFIANSTLVATAEETERTKQAKDIAEIQNKELADQRKELTENAWRTYYSARTSAERERILGQIQAMAEKPPTVVAPEVHVVRSGSGSIWNKWLGLRPEAVQEAKAVIVPVLIMFFKTVGLTIGCAYWPMQDPLSAPSPAPRAKESGFWRPIVSRQYSVDEARSDVLKLTETGVLDDTEVTAEDFAARWGIGRTTARERLHQFAKERLIVLERGRGRVGNRLLVRAAPQPPNNKATTHG